MKHIALLFVCLAGCNSKDDNDTAKDEETLTCMGWYHQCNCDYVCETEADYDDYIASGIGSTCDIDCDSASMGGMPGSCEVVEESCSWVE